MVTQIKSDANFNELISDNNLSVIHFSAEWAEQCKHVNEVLNEISKLPDLANTSTKFCECLAEELAEVSMKYQIEAVPTVLLFRSGKLIDRINGADAGKISAKVKEHLSTKGANVAVSKKDEPLENRLKALINRHKIMVFMKGDRDQPRCGFSKQLMQILQGLGVSYDTFDILQDEEVRQGLKVFSDWPTYPQLYVNGELVGGLDIIKELQAGGELLSTLNA